MDSNAGVLQSRDAAANLVCDFLEACVHLLLSIRGVYPPEVFERRRCFNVPIQWARHPELKDYIHTVVSNLRDWIKQGVVEKVAVVVMDKEKIAWERYVFKFRLDQSYSKEFPLEDLEYALRAFFIKLSASQHLLSSLLPECSWELVAYSKQLPSDTSASEYVWIPAESEVWQDPPDITPIKSMKSQPLDVQLYIEQPSRGKAIQH